MKFESYVAREIADESEEVRTFRFAKESGGIPAYQPGHFFLLRMSGEDGKPVQRSYSAASHPSEPMLSFCIKLKGAFTHLLWKLSVGDKVEIDGPYGIFLLKRDDAERVFIGGGGGHFRLAKPNPADNKGRQALLAFPFCPRIGKPSIPR